MTRPKPHRLAEVAAAEGGRSAPQHREDDHRVLVASGAAEAASKADVRMARLAVQTRFRADAKLKLPITRLPGLVSLRPRVWHEATSAGLGLAAGKPRPAAESRRAPSPAPERCTDTYFAPPWLALAAPGDTSDTSAAAAPRQEGRASY